MLAIERGQKSLEVACAPIGSHQRTQIGLDGFVRQPLGMLVGRTQGLSGAEEILVREHGVERAAEASRRRHLEEGLERFRRPVVVRVAIREREAAHTRGIERREDLRDAAAAVVTDQVHLVDLEHVHELPQHLRVRGHRHVLVRSDLRLPVRQQVDRDAAAHVRQLRQLVAPQVPVEQYAVHKQRDRPGARLGVADAARASDDAAPCRHLIGTHRSILLALSRSMRLPQRLRAGLAAHLHRVSADRHRDGVGVELAVAGSAGFCRHDSTSLMTRCAGGDRKSIPAWRPLSESLAIC